jgi:hypothetical protein
MRDAGFLRSPVFWVGLFFTALLLRMDALRPLLQQGFPGVEPIVYNRDSFLALFLSQLGLVATASLGTIGSTVGALTLGTPIFDGLVTNKLPFVLEGAVLVALFAILTDLLFARLERRLR